MSFDMATEKQRSAAERNVEQAQAGARGNGRWRTLPKATKSALRRRGAAVAQRERTGASSPKTRSEFYAIAKERALPARSRMGRDGLARALHIN
jgi:hypothetical protein